MDWAEVWMAGRCTIDLSLELVEIGLVTLCGAGGQHGTPPPAADASFGTRAIRPTGAGRSNGRLPPSVELA
jgi:hypothetical protein